jgi:ribose-phosphate pyrophosphokinase
MRNLCSMRGVETRSKLLVQTSLSKASFSDSRFFQVLSCPEYENLAQEVCFTNPDRFVRGSIDWSSFPDTFPNLFLSDAAELKKHQGVVFLASFHEPKVIFAQLSVIYSLPLYLARSLTVVLPYFPTGTMERIDREGQVATAMTLARCLSATPLSRAGPTHLLIYDLHALQERFYFHDSVIPLCDTATPLFRRCVAQLGNNVTIAFPDEGAWKRFGSMWQPYPVVICSKVRAGDSRVITILEGECKGRHVVIVDDLVQTGGTLLECSKVLLKCGALQVSACCTHAVFPRRSWLKFVGSDFCHFWVTNSVPTTADQLVGQHPFEVISLAGSISGMVLDGRAPAARL